MLKRGLQREFALSGWLECLICWLTNLLEASSRNGESSHDPVLRYLNSELADVAVNEMEQLYLEDLRVGKRFTSGTYVIEAAEIKEFAARFDPQPFHSDENAAQATVLQGLAASGWHTAAVAMRLLVTGGLPLAGGILGLGGEIAWPKPTRPGDTLRVESEVVEIRPSRSKPQQAVVTVRSTMLNQNQEPVYILNGKVLAFKRPV